MLLITTPFVLGIASGARDAHDPLIEWLSLLPPLSPILMPARILLGTAPVWQIALSLVLAVAALAGMTRVAGRMYANSSCAAAPGFRSPRRCGCVSRPNLPSTVSLHPLPVIPCPSSVPLVRPPTPCPEHHHPARRAARQTRSPSRAPPSGSPSASPFWSP